VVQPYFVPFFWLLLRKESTLLYNIIIVLLSGPPLFEPYNGNATLFKAIYLLMQLLFTSSSMKMTKNKTKKNMTNRGIC